MSFADAVDSTQAGSGAPPRDPVVRRAPFSANPTVGPRGQRTQQRILEAALKVLREQGYERCSVDQITKQAGCSRVSFYQYFSGKEQVYYELAGQVVRQVRASVEALDLVQPDADGWLAIRAWTARTGDIFERYGAVFTAFEAGPERADEVAVMRATTAANVAGIGAKLAGVTLPSREIDTALTLLLGCFVRTFQHAEVLRASAPEAFPRERIEDALTDVFHRTFFGLQPGINTRDPSGHASPPVLAFDATTRERLNEAREANRPGSEALLTAGRSVLVQRGYHATRVEDIVAAAGVSRAAFYRQFANKDEFAEVLVLEAIRPLSQALAGIPSNAADGAVGMAALRRWLRRYNASHVHEAAIIRVWMDANVTGAALGTDAAPALDWGRRRLADFLRPRRFDDLDADAVIIVALLDAFGSHPRPDTTVDAAAHVIRRGLLGG